MKTIVSSIVVVCWVETELRRGLSMRSWSRSNLRRVIILLRRISRHRPREAEVDELIGGTRGRMGPQSADSVWIIWGSYCRAWGARETETGNPMYRTHLSSTVCQLGTSLGSDDDEIWSLINVIVRCPTCLVLRAGLYTTPNKLSNWESKANDTDENGHRIYTVRSIL